METPPWTVSAFRKRRHDTWRAIRIWVIVFLVGVIGFTIPFWLNREHVQKKADGTYALSFGDETIGQFTLGLMSFVATGTAMVAIILAVRRHYRCPKCNEVPMGNWTALGPGSIGFDEGVAINPSVCPSCGAQLSSRKK